MAGANLRAALSVQSHLAATLAADTAPVRFADALPRRGIASQRILQVAIAALRTVLSESARFAFLLTLFAGPSRRTGALAIDRIADTTVRAVALLGAVLAITMRIARSITADSLPTGRAEALTGFRSTRGPILALTSFATVLAVRSVIALLFAVFSLEAGNAIAGAVDVIAG